MGRIVVGIDESNGAADALRWAAREADLRRWSLTAVLAWNFLDQHHPVVGEPFDPDYGEADAVAALDAIVTATLGAPRAATVEMKAINELPAFALLDESDGADLLVVGARGLGPLRGLLLGSVSQKCLYRATCPVAIVRDDIPVTDGRIARIVVGIDGSDTARRALDWALEEGRLHHASVEVVHAWTVPYGIGEPLAPATFDPRSVETAARRALDATIEAADTTGVPAVIPTVAIGSAAAGILDAAQGADLVVVGSRGRGGFKGLVLGSTSHHLAHHSTCAVVVLPPTPQ